MCLTSKKLGTNGWSGYLTYQSRLWWKSPPTHQYLFQSPGLAYPFPTQDISSLRLAPLPPAPLIKPSAVALVFLALLVSWIAPGPPLPSLLSLSHLSPHPIQSGCALPHIYNKPFPQPHPEHHVLSLFHSSGENSIDYMISVRHIVHSISTVILAACRSFVTEMPERYLLRWPLSAGWY